jgi:N6-L-threonylcarbamoyladenine synthase
MLVLAESLTSFRILATTKDESIGRTFDKISRKLEIDWGASAPGAALEAFCHESGDEQWPSGFTPFPRPIPNQLAFSYSSLHSHFDRYLDTVAGGITALSLEQRRAIARSFQDAAILQLKDKLTLALNWCDERQITIRNLVVSGGVASNSFLRSRFVPLLWLHSRLRAFFSLRELLASTASKQPIAATFPPPDLCTGECSGIWCYQSTQPMEQIMLL